MRKINKMRLDGSSSFSEAVYISHVVEMVNECMSKLDLKIAFQVAEVNFIIQIPYK